MRRIGNGAKTRRRQERMGPMAFRGGDPPLLKPVQKESRRIQQKCMGCLLVNQGRAGPMASALSVK